MADNQEEFERLIQKAAELRGHCCMGLPLGIKMAQLGLKLIGMSEEEKRENLVVFVENDKCPADAIQIATGCSAGSRRFKMMPYGKPAATFADGETGKGYRVKEKRDVLSRAIALAVSDGLIQQDEPVKPQSKLERKILMNAFMKLAPEEILAVQAVKVTLDRPLHSPKESKQYCVKCGEELGNAQGTGTLCIACLKGAYYQPL